MGAIRKFTEQANTILDCFAKPGNEHAERYVLGAVLRKEDLSSQAKTLDDIGLLRPEDFARESHRQILKAMRLMREKGILIEVMSLKNELELAHSELDFDWKYLVELEGADRTTANARYYATLVRNEARRRDAILLGMDLQRSAQDHELDLDGLSQLNSRFQDLLATGSTSNFPCAVGADELPGECELDWIWESYLARGHLTLCSAIWKAGKSTLLAHLLQAMDLGGHLLGKTVHPAKVLVATEEPLTVWKRRKKDFPLNSTHFISLCDFQVAPSPTNWLALLRHIDSEARRLKCSVLVFDVLQSFWGVTDENDPPQVLQAVYPLRKLANTGFGILLFGHTAKTEAGKGKAARGTGALSGAVDQLIEIRRFDASDMTNSSRELTSFGRLQHDPVEIVFSYDKESHSYHVEGSPQLLLAQRQNQFIKDMLRTANTNGLTTNQLHQMWMNAIEEKKCTLKCPALRTLQQLLPNGASANPPHWRYEGGGTPHDPRRYFLLD